MLQQIPGFVGYAATKISSLDGRAIGKLTDSNHLSSLRLSEPAEYDKKIIQIYTQTSLFASDWIQMLNKTTPYFINANSDSWQWEIEVPYKYPRIIEVPGVTQALAKPGIDGKEFFLVLDRNDYVKGDVITSQQYRLFTPLVVTKDPEPYNGGWLYTFTILSENPNYEFIDKKFISVGVELQHNDHIMGEYSRDFSALPALGSKIKMYSTLGSGYGVKHTITDWADSRTLRDQNGKPLDIMVYGNIRRSETASSKSIGVRWEPFIETKMRQEMLSMRTRRHIFGMGGSFRDNNSRQNITRVSPGVYKTIMDYGNVARYNRGQFNAQFLRDVFGDLFYRRVGVKDRRVKMFTNEAGIEVFRTAAKNDALGSGLTFIADNRFIDGIGQNMMLNYAFDAMTSIDTGKIEVIHLTELDLPQTNLEFGQNKKSTPIFFVFDVSPMGDGSLANNIREVRQSGSPSMTWGYIDGTRSHLGFAASQGMSSANDFPGYSCWMKDRSDVFIEDVSRCVIIEENPVF